MGRKEILTAAAVIIAAVAIVGSFCIRTWNNTDVSSESGIAGTDGSDESAGSGDTEAADAEGSAGESGSDAEYEYVSYIEDDTNIKDLYPLAEDDAHKVIDPILEANEDALTEHGIMLDTAKRAVVRKDDDEYIFFVNDMYVMVNTAKESLYIASDDTYFGSDEEGAESQKRGDAVRKTLKADENILYALNVTIEDLWHEILYGGYGIQETEDEGVYTIMYNGKTVLVDTVNVTASIVED